MLRSLQIENVAVIEKAQIDFDDGFCALTGETGAGKSILIDSLSAVLGSRTSKDLVRRGSERAAVTALFEECSAVVMELLKEMGFAADDNSLLLQRIITADGRTTCRINGYPANATVIRRLAVHLVNIYGQQENHVLLDPAGHVDFVDRLLDDDALVFRYQQAYKSLRVFEAERDALQMNEADKARRIDMLKYQVNELTAANLQIGEYEQLQARQKAIANAEKIAAAFAGVMAMLDGDGEQAGAVDLTRSAAEQLAECSRYLNVAEQSERLTSMGYELEALRDEIRGLADDLMFDPQEQAALEERLDVLYHLARKYGSNEEDMLAFLQKAQDELDALERTDEAMQALNGQIDAALKHAQDLAAELRAQRHAAAKKLDAAVAEELRFLNMPDVAFKTSFTECALYNGGSERVEFLISANPGEPPKPLAKIASGGELSRIMLAIISALTQKDDVSTMIFDEIDAGISGRAALKVGDRLKKTAKGRQVICITHLAQIAAKADAHYLIEKTVREGRAVTSVTRLLGNDRLQELARIIGGPSATEAALQTARELIEESNDQQ